MNPVVRKFPGCLEYRRRCGVGEPGGSEIPWLPGVPPPVRSMRSAYIPGSVLSRLLAIIGFAHPPGSVRNRRPWQPLYRECYCGPNLNYKQLRRNSPGCKGSMDRTTKNEYLRLYDLRMWRATVAVLLVAAVVPSTACSPKAPASGEWTVLTLDGAPLLAGTEIRLDLGDSGFLELCAWGARRRYSRGSAASSPGWPAGAASGTAHCCLRGAGRGGGRRAAPLPDTGGPSPAAAGSGSGGEDHHNQPGGCRHRGTFCGTTVIRVQEY